MPMVVVIRPALSQRRADWAHREKRWIDRAGALPPASEAIRTEEEQGDS